MWQRQAKGGSACARLSAGGFIATAALSIGRLHTPAPNVRTAECSALHTTQLPTARSSSKKKRNSSSSSSSLQRGGVGSYTATGSSIPQQGHGHDEQQPPGSITHHLLRLQHDKPTKQRPLSGLWTGEGLQRGGRGGGRREVG